MTDRLAVAFARFDALNAEDPNMERDGDRLVHKELLYAERMSLRLASFAPEASEAVRLATRAQHIQRWKISRADYPRDRVGYLRWRQALYAHHAELATSVLRDIGYDEETIARVDRLLRKKGLKTDPEAQLVEDIACLTFLEHYFASFAAGQEPAKLKGIVQKTWAKMSDAAHQAALALPWSEPQLRLIERAIGSP